MFPSLNKKLQQMIENMDPKTLEKGFKSFNELMNTEEGKKIAYQLQNIDKEKLMQYMNGISEERLIETLDHVDANGLSESINNMKNEKILQELTNDPALLEKLRQFMNSKQ